MDGSHIESYLSFSTSQSLSSPVLVLYMSLSPSQIQLVLSHSPWNPKWAVSTPPFSTDVLIVCPYILRPQTIFSLVSVFVLRRQSSAKADWNQTSEDKLLLTSCCAPNRNHSQRETDVDGDRKRRRGISSSRQMSRRELWERARFDMRISLCKHLE